MKKRLIIISLALTMLCAAIPAGINAFAAGDVTRAEWVSQLVAAFDMTVENDDNMPDNYFSDISEDMPYYRDILLAVEFGVINIEAGEPFRPDEPATREFAAQTLNSCLLFQLGEGEGYTFAESGSVTYPDDIQVAINRGWFKLSGNSFMPNQAVTTAEMTAMLDDAKAVLASEVIDENHQNTFEFAEGVIEVPQTANTSITADNTVTITDYDPKIKAGDIFVVYTGGLPVALKATNIKIDGNITTIAASKEGAEGAIVSADAEGVIDVDLENIEAPEPVTFQVYNTVTAASEDFTVEAAGIHYDKKTKTLTATQKIKLGSSAAGSVTAKLSSIKLHHKFSNKEAYITANSTVTTDISFDFADYAGIPSSLTLGTVPIAGVGSITLSMEYSMKGGVTMVWNGTIKAGFSYSDHEFRLIKSYKKTGFSFTAEVDIKAGVKIYADIDVFFAKGSVWATVGVRMNAKLNSYDSGSPQTCLTIKGYLYAQVGANASIIGVDVFSKTQDIFNEYNSPVRVVYHYEDGVLVSTCSRGEDLSYTTSPWSKYFNPYYAQGSYGDGITAEPIIIWEYKVEDDGNATITKFRGNASAVSIPETIDGYTVTKIGIQAFSKNTIIRSVIIPNTVISIGNTAFYNCINLSSVKLPSNIQTIESGAFNGCISLIEIFIPKTLQTCAGAFRESGIVSAEIESGMTEIPTSLFTDCEQLKDVAIPDTVTRIGVHAFSSCLSLETINIPDSVTAIGNSAFHTCSQLSQIELPKYVTVIEPGAFNECTSLEEIFIPKTLTAGANAFGGSGIVSAEIESGMTEIPTSLFTDCEHLKNVVIPDTVVRIGVHAFSSCLSLETINIPDSVTAIGNSAFHTCSQLSQIELPKYVTVIEPGAFNECTSLEEIFIPKTLTAGANAFGGSGIVSAEIESGMTEIPTSLFTDCEHLKNVTIPDTVVKIGNYTFSSCLSLETIVMPNSLNEMGQSIFNGCTSLKSVNIPNTMIYIPSSTFSNCSSLENIQLPETILSIGGNSFNGCTSLKNIKIPDSITDINSSTFEGCSSLSDVIFPKNLKNIYSRAFANCSRLKEVIIPNTVSNISSSAYENCDGLERITINMTGRIDSKAFYDCDALTSISIADGVTEIGRELCYGCDKLTDVKLGKYIEKIPDSAFRLCQSLETINIPRFCTTIAANAFAEDTKLSSAYIPPYVTKIENNSFSYPAKMTVYGKSGSYAEEYAKSRNMKFSAVDAPITSISFAENEVFADRYKDIVLPMNITPEFDTDTITFSSSDENVATVKENGVINTKNYGTTTITASTSGGRTATCALRVLSDGTIIKFDSEKNGDTANVHIETGIVPAGAEVYIAAYDRDGVLTSFTTADLADYTADTTIPTTGARKLKAFIWDPKTLKPLTPAKEINI